jgi:phage FluMu protein gp41
MTEPSTPTAALSPPERIDDLFKLILADGLSVESAGKTIRYQCVTLRETNVADERRAEALSERAMNVNGGWKLLVSESNFKHALNMMHIASFHCDELSIPQPLIDLAMYDKLSSRDLQLIEERIFLLTLASEVRYGNMTQADFEAIAAGLAPVKAVAASPQPSGQTAGVASLDERAESGPALLADYAGDAAQSAPEGHGGAVQ